MVRKIWIASVTYFNSCVATVVNIYDVKSWPFKGTCSNLKIFPHYGSWRLGIEGLAPHLFVIDTSKAWAVEENIDRLFDTKLPTAVRQRAKYSFSCLARLARKHRARILRIEKIFRSLRSILISPVASGILKIAPGESDSDVAFSGHWRTYRIESMRQICTGLHCDIVEWVRREASSEVHGEF